MRRSASRVPVREPGPSLLLFAALVSGACGGGGSLDGGRTMGDTAGTGQPPATSAPATAGVPPSPSSPGGDAVGGGTAPTDARLISLGDSIFRGQAAGGTCQACHGVGAIGTPAAPNLADSQWLNGDGSYQFIVTTVANGVQAPKQYPGPMPPMGGAPLSPEQVRAVAAYVFSLSPRG